MNEIMDNISLFESIKHYDEDGNEYWEARELQKTLGYSQWRRFNETIEKAKLACDRSQIPVELHFANAGKLSKRHNNAEVLIVDYKLSRYACYLIAQNGDPRKKVIALAQTYFAIQTRKQELNELSEDQKRIIERNKTKAFNKELNITAVKHGVKNLDKFTNAGYKGLYNGETANDIAKRKGLRYREDILDNMGSEELADNLFRIIHTQNKIVKENIQGEKESCDAHYYVGKKVREFIKELDGTMPEELPNPDKSIKRLKEKN